LGSGREPCRSATLGGPNRETTPDPCCRHSAFVQTRAVELDPKVLVYKLPDQINWGPVTPAGNQQAVLFGDPSKPGLYGVMVKWLAGNHFSRPHFHPNDRFITTLSGTWWVGSGPDFDSNTSSVAMPAGSYYGKQVH
jgi:hypothetical protein